MTHFVTPVALERAARGVITWRLRRALRSAAPRHGTSDAARYHALRRSLVRDSAPQDPIGDAQRRVFLGEIAAQRATVPLPLRGTPDAVVAYRRGVRDELGVDSARELLLNAALARRADGSLSLRRSKAKAALRSGLESMLASGRVPRVMPSDAARGERMSDALRGSAQVNAIARDIKRMESMQRGADVLGARHWRAAPMGPDTTPHDAATCKRCAAGASCRIAMAHTAAMGAAVVRPTGRGQLDAPAAVVKGSPTVFATTHHDAIGCKNCRANGAVREYPGGEWRIVDAGKACHVDPTWEPLAYLGDLTQNVAASAHGTRDAALGDIRDRILRDAHNASKRDFPEIARQVAAIGAPPAYVAALFRAVDGKRRAALCAALRRAGIDC